MLWAVHYVVPRQYKIFVLRRLRFKTVFVSPKSLFGKFGRSQKDLPKSFS